ncbi:MAG: SPOR domain-containing protein [Polaribacter sp.]|nr:SPOR domain-containing protein [Polaribacter sp.]
MNKTSILILVLLFVFSCGKKEVKSEIEEIKAPAAEIPVDKDKKEIKIDEQDEISALIFTVQIAALKNQNEDLENIDEIKVYYENDLIKYRLGNFETYQEAREFRSQILNEYNDAFIQALKNDRPIFILEAL